MIVAVAIAMIVSMLVLACIRCDSIAYGLDGGLSGGFECLDV